MMGWIVFGFILLVVIGVVAWLIGVFNNLVRVKERVSNAMAQIAAQVESRWDALSNLISATQQYTEHESSTLTQVIQARSGITSQSSAEDVEKDDQQFEQAMANIDVVVEQYPELKASELYKETMRSVNDYEHKVRQSRMVYNDTVTRYNQTIKLFPAFIVANSLGYVEEPYFEGTEKKADMPVWN